MLRIPRVDPLHLFFSNVAVKLVGSNIGMDPR